MNLVYTLTPSILKANFTIIPSTPTGMFSEVFLSFMISDKNFLFFVLVLHVLLDLLGFIAHSVGVAETLSYCFKIV